MTGRRAAAEWPSRGRQAAENRCGQGRRSLATVGWTFAARRSCTLGSGLAVAEADGVGGVSVARAVHVQVVMREDALWLPQPVPPRRGPSTPSSSWSHRDVRTLLWRDVLVRGERHADLAIVELDADVGVAVPVVMGPMNPEGRLAWFSDWYITPTTGALLAVLVRSTRPGIRFHGTVGLIPLKASALISWSSPRPQVPCRRQGSFRPPWPTPRWDSARRLGGP